MRHRAKLVAWRSGLKASVHAVLAKQGLHLLGSDLFGVTGRRLLAAAPLDPAYRLRVNALLRLIDAVDFEIRAVAGPLRVALADDPGFAAHLRRGIKHRAHRPELPVRHLIAPYLVRTGRRRRRAAQSPLEKVPSQTSFTKSIRRPIPG